MNRRRMNLLKDLIDLLTGGDIHGTLIAKKDRFFGGISQNVANRACHIAPPGHELVFGVDPNVHGVRDILKENLPNMDMVNKDVLGRGYAAKSCVSCMINNNLQ